MIVIDLNCAAIDPLRLIGELKLTGIPLLGFVSHVQGELKLKAQEAGCDMVLARSAFSQNMQQIFKRYAGPRSGCLCGAGYSAAACLQQARSSLEASRPEGGCRLIARPTSCSCRYKHCRRSDSRGADRRILGGPSGCYSHGASVDESLKDLRSS